MSLKSTLTATVAVLSTAAGAAACPLHPGEPTLEEVRAATERFRDVDVALAEGYLRDPLNLCDTAEMMGRLSSAPGASISSAPTCSASPPHPTRAWTATESTPTSCCPRF